MSRSPAASALAPSSSLLLLPLLLIRPFDSSSVWASDSRTRTATAAYDSCSVKSCAALDMALLQEYVASLNASGPDWPRGSSDRAASASADESGILRPFGALATDWPRLLLLQNGQPEGTALRENLLRLSRLVLAAYFESEDGPGWGILEDGQDSITSTASYLETSYQDIRMSNLTVDSINPKKITRTNASSDDVFNNTSTSAGETSGNTLSDPFTGNRYYETDLPTTESLPDSSEQPSTKNLQLTQPADDSNSRFAPTLTTQYFGDRNSTANEVLHEYSKEDFPQSQYGVDEGVDSAGLEYVDSTVDRFFASESREGSGSNHIESVEAFFAAEDTVNKSAPPIESSAERGESAESTRLLTESVEASFDLDRSANEDADLFEFNSTKSLEEFFASAEVATDKQNTDFPPAVKRGIKVEGVRGSSNSAKSSSGLEVVGKSAATPKTPTDGSIACYRCAEMTESSTSLQPSDGFGFAPSKELEEALDNFQPTLESSSMGDDGSSGTTTTTTLVGLISRGLRLTAASALLHPNGIAANGTRAPTAKYSDILLTSGISGNPKRVEGESRVDVPASAPDDSRRNGTGEQGDDLFSEAGTSSLERTRLERNLSSPIAASAEAMSLEATNTLRFHRRILMSLGRQATASASGKLRKPEASFRIMGEEDEWSSRKGAFSLPGLPPVAPLRSRELGRRGEIVGDARMNKRKSRKRAGAELDVERQYRTFFGREPRQTDNTEKRLDSGGS